MDKSFFEGSIVVEKLAAIEKEYEFFEAVDSDNFSMAEKLMKMAKVEPKIIAIVIRKMKESEGEQ